VLFCGAVIEVLAGVGFTVAVRMMALQNPTSGAGTGAAWQVENWLVRAPKSAGRIVELGHVPRRLATARQLQSSALGKAPEFMAVFS
jgi:hypothetical protein